LHERVSLRGMAHLDKLLKLLREAEQDC
jgi:hypothetical protein